MSTAVDQVRLAAGWSPRPHNIGSIQTRRTRIADAPADHQVALTEPVCRALIEAARRRRDRLQGRSGTPVDPPLSPNFRADSEVSA